MSHTKVMYQRPSTRDAITLRPVRQPYERALRKPKSTHSEAVSKLKTSYSHAARAFLHHRIEDAHALVEEAFELLYPPVSRESDPFSTHRRKWDILRITLETTLYTSPISGSALRQSIRVEHPPPSAPFPQSPNGAPSPRSKTPLMDDPLLLSPPSLLGTLHTRSLKLFTPSTDRPSSRFLPAPVLVALVLACLKLDCPQVGRGMLEDWLANRDIAGPGSSSDASVARREEAEREGYEKVIEVYCLHVLPRLNEWDYAKEFLDSEMEMSPTKREELIKTLATHHAQSLLPPSPKTSQLRQLDNSVSGSSGAPTPRAVSPAPSSVSSHTAVPNSRSAASLLHNKSVLTTPSPLSPSSTITARPQHSLNIPSSGIAPTTIAIPPAASLAAQPSSPTQPTIIQLLKAVIIPYLRRLNAPVVLLAIVLSLAGLATRFGRRPKGGTGAEIARRRLAGGSRGLWGGLVDAVKMSGRGLV